MTGDPELFLKWNKDEIFKGLIAVENHFRYLRSGDYGCIIKHLAEVEGHCDEAISHAAELGLEDMSSKFRELRDMVKELREKLHEYSQIEGIKRVRELRKFFESFNPEYSVKCACGHNSYTELEKEYAEKLLDMLSKEYNVPKPRLVILDNCPVKEPVVFGEFRVTDAPEIVLCKSSVDLHKIFHEWHHYLQYLEKKPLDEKSAEEYALVKARHNGSYNYKALTVAGVSLVGLAYSLAKRDWIASPILAGIFLIALASVK